MSGNKDKEILSKIDINDSASALKKSKIQSVSHTELPALETEDPFSRSYSSRRALTNLISIEFGTLFSKPW